MLLSKQWSRIAACVLAALVFLFLLRNLHILRQYSNLLSAGEDDLAASHAQEALYRLQNEEQEKAPMEPALESDPGSLPEVAAALDAESELSITSPTTTEVASHTSAHIFLEGTRAPKPATEVFSVDRPTNQNPQAAGDNAATAAEPTSSSFRKTIVMGKLSEEDTVWVQDAMTEWESAIYVVDLPDNVTSPTGFRTKINKSKEAMPYLTYIVEHYDNLPDVAVFMHAHRNGWPQAWHNDAHGYDAVNMLNELKLDTVMERGYANLRCISEPGCPDEMQLNRSPPDQSKHAEIAYPFVYGQFFNISVDEVKQQVPVIATQCCAQFTVSREQLLKRPKSEYERYVALIEESKYDDETLGTVMEYMWHILMGQEAVHCEDTTQCWAEVFGREEGWSPFG